MRPSPYNLLRWSHRRRLWAATAWIAAAGWVLALGLEHWGAGPSTWLRVLESTAVLALGARLFRRRSLRASACELDARLGLANRLEACAACATRDDPLAVALRSEAAAFAARRRLRASWIWLLGPAATVFLGCWAFPPLRPRPGKIGLQAETTARAGKTLVVSNRTRTPRTVVPGPATLRWLSPRTPVTATPAEIVPLTVQAESVTGMSRFLLHVAVNGKPAPSVPESCVAAPGEQVLSLTFDLRPVGARPADVVEYFLTARRRQPPAGGAGSPEPAIASPAQTIRIRPLRAGLTPAMAVWLPVAALPDRAQAPAGRLQHLAAEQHALAGRIAEGTEGPEATVAEDRIAHDLLPLSTFDGFSPATRAAIKSAAAQAKMSAGQLNAGDQRAATEPAAVADQTLADTNGRLDAAGRTKALAELAAAQHALIRAADDLIGASGLNDRRGAQSAFERTATARNALARLAFQQQRQGSDKAARQLDRLRRAIDRSQVQSDLKQLVHAGNQTDRPHRGNAAGESKPFKPTRPAASGKSGGNGRNGGGGSPATPPGGSRASSSKAGLEEGKVHAGTGSRSARESAGSSANSSGSGRTRQGSGGQVSSVGGGVASGGAVGGDGAGGRGKGGGAARAGVAETLLALSQQAANAQRETANLGELTNREIDGLRRDLANLDRAVALGSQATLGLYESTVAATQLLPYGKELALPPPPIPGRSSLPGFARTLGVRIKDLLAHLPAPPEVPARSQTLVIGRPGQAPAPYRAAVADYFETLARAAAPRTAGGRAR